MIDFLPDIDGDLIPARENPDQVKNAHAESFITFLKDNRSVILNGRITPQFNNYTFVNPRGCSVPDYLFTPVDHLNSCKEMKTFLISDLVNTLNIQPSKSLPDHSILRGTFVTSFFDKCSLPAFPQHFPNLVPRETVAPSNRTKKKNISKMPENFFMTAEIHQQVLQTIENIENATSTKDEINQLWAQIKNLFSEELGKLPNVPRSKNKKQNKLFRKSQPFWNADLEELWKTTCQIEKNFLNFKVRTHADNQTKSQLRLDFKNAQKVFDKQFRQTERKYKKQQNQELENNAKFNPTGMWSSLKKLNNPPSSRVALEIVRADRSISRDLKEILERWLKDISTLFSGVREDPAMSFDDNFYEEILNKKQQFENLTNFEQQQSTDFSTDQINNEILFSEVSNAIDKIKFHKAYLDIPNEAMKNFNAKCLLHKFYNLCFKSGLSPVEWDFSDIIPIPKKDKDARDPLQNRCITIMCCVAKVY